VGNCDLGGKRVWGEEGEVSCQPLRRGGRGEEELVRQSESHTEERKRGGGAGGGSEEETRGRKVQRAKRRRESVGSLRGGEST